MDYENNTNVAPATSSLILEERHDSELFRVYALIFGRHYRPSVVAGQKTDRVRALPTNGLLAQYRAWRIVTFGAR